MKVSKNKFLLGFSIVVVVLALVRCMFPSVAKPIKSPQKSNIQADIKTSDKYMSSRFFNRDGSLVKNKILSVSSFKDAFPDENDVQLLAANKYGVMPLTNISQASTNINELVYVGSNPYYYVDKLNSSVPYLVPKAAVLLQNIGKNFFDSLQIKGLPLQKIIVTSVMRSIDDVEKLATRNLNAKQNSAHLYGTTFDVCYNRYKALQAPDEPPLRAVRNDTLKWVLSEVLNDMRIQGRCYVKYEVHQGCFHITVR